MYFEYTTPYGVVQSCEWVRIEVDLIKEIRSFYDNAVIRAVLPPAEQKKLEASS